jgi:hypothetical protein
MAQGMNFAVRETQILPPTSSIATILLRPFLLLLTFMLLSACYSSKNTTPAASLRNTRWALRALAGTPITTPATSQEIYLQFNATTK